MGAARAVSTCRVWSTGSTTWVWWWSLRNSWPMRTTSGASGSPTSSTRPRSSTSHGSSSQHTMCTSGAPGGVACTIATSCFRAGPCAPCRATAPWSRASRAPSSWVKVTRSSVTGPPSTDPVDVEVELSVTGVRRDLHRDHVVTLDARVSDAGAGVACVVQADRVPVQLQLGALVGAELKSVDPMVETALSDPKRGVGDAQVAQGLHRQVGGRQAGGAPSVRPSVEHLALDAHPD